MMGNIIYLVAANSHQKNNQSWAISMTYYFWAYRVLSSWILLILISVFSTTNFSSPGLNSYHTRHAETIENHTSFGIFVYCWIATPLWQWCGAVIIFDYKNLGSVARDVSQLVADGKWPQVLELIKFGATFDAQNMLESIYNQYDDTNQTLFEQILVICLETIKQNNDSVKVTKHSRRHLQQNFPVIFSQILSSP
eukprot:12772_1